jgi:small subunit ribosomal protein S8
MICSSDSIGDMFARLRNAHKAGHNLVEMPHSKLKGEISRILKREGFISDYVIEGGAIKKLRIYLKYGKENEPAIRGLKRISKPGLRRYVSAGKIPRTLSGFGIAILSTSSGMMTDKEARSRKIGGEILGSVW